MDFKARRFSIFGNTRDKKRKAEAVPALTCTLWSRLPERGVRGPLFKKDENWPYGSRQVRRRAMFLMYYRQMSMFDIPRQNRRLAARSKMSQVYRKVAADMIASSGTLAITKKDRSLRWYQGLVKFSKELFA